MAGGTAAQRERRRRPHLPPAAASLTLECSEGHAMACAVERRPSVFAAKGDFSQSREALPPVGSRPRSEFTG
jgi:hypothetical protein